MRFKEDCLKEQDEVRAKDREKVVEWFFELQMKYALKNETIYLAVNILDRYLERQKISKRKLSLLGLVAVLIAGKYEEIYPPHIKNYLARLGEKFTPQECTEMELTVLNTLNYNLSTPSVLAFLGRYVKFVDLDKTRRRLAMYICEAQLLTTILNKHEPSLLALGGLYLAAKSARENFSFSEELLRETRHSEDEVKECAKDMLGNMLVKERIMLSNVRKKHAKSKEVVKVSLSEIKV
eukprot:TRINITY_DN4002_c0_g1_i2.p1 TRINITY_DN4002_c0_g1~~TRINITY_DN4002_c0_g1_i2.p1  ORF type:complete len:237 (+),score=101.43 TRINITY_DN4002_c0_g1_i2:444-1154(+)